MAAAKHYTLTELADANLVELKAWSRARWGRELTRRYLADLHAGAEQLAASYKRLPARAELAADTGLSLYPVREHYIVFFPVAKAHIVIVAILRQGRDIPALLRANHVRIERELREIRSRLRQGKIRIR